MNFHCEDVFFSLQLSARRLLSLMRVFTGGGFWKGRVSTENISDVCSFFFGRCELLLMMRGVACETQKVLLFYDRRVNSQFCNFFSPSQKYIPTVMHVVFLPLDAHSTGSLYLLRRRIAAIVGVARAVPVRRNIIAALSTSGIG